jgi:hypothetical protein
VLPWEALVGLMAELSDNPGVQCKWLAAARISKHLVNQYSVVPSQYRATNIRTNLRFSDSQSSRRPRSDEATKDGTSNPNPQPISTPFLYHLHHPSQEDVLTILFYISNNLGCPYNLTQYTVDSQLRTSSQPQQRHG